MRLIKRLLRKLYYGFYRKIFPDYPVELEKAVGDCKTLLDIGCGSNSPIKSFQHRHNSAMRNVQSATADLQLPMCRDNPKLSLSGRLYSVGVDAFKPSVEKARKEKIHDRYYVMDVLKIGKAFKPNSFDCVLASDIIEHLTKEDGYRLLVMMERIARRKVVIFTPNGFMPQGAFEGNPWQEHKSGWTTEEMKKKGYEVTGINGYKPLRYGGQEEKYGEHFTDIKHKPKYFWLVVSDLT